MAKKAMKAKISKCISFDDTEFFREFLSKQSNFSSSVRALIYEHVHRHHGEIDDVGKALEKQFSKYLTSESYSKEKAEASRADGEPAEGAEPAGTAAAESAAQARGTAPKVAASLRPIQEAEPEPDEDDADIPACYR